MDNPTLIYEAPFWAQASTPLVLIHDGGGLTFSYHCLDPTNRPLYGVHNTHFDEGGFWEGGIPEMARYYIELIAEALPSGGDIILGGWSLGGLLSIEMAHQLAARASGTSPSFRVLGLILIDSVCPEGLRFVKEWPSEPVLKTREQLAPLALREKVDLNMENARVMVKRWDMPRWEGALAPPAVLLRAKEPVEHETQAFVDQARADELLGWGRYNEEHGSFIRDVVNIEGNHFTIFKEDYIPELTKQICAAATAIDEKRI